MKKGFTLIELLVVVLIIGILAAVALPQYQAAITKSRASEILSVLRTVKQTFQAYKLENGDYPLLWEEIDVDIPHDRTSNDGLYDSIFLDSKNIQYYITSSNGARVAAGSYTAGNININISWWAEPSGAANKALYDHSFVCRAQGDKSSNQACISLGGVFKGVQPSTSWNVYAIN